MTTATAALVEETESREQAIELCAVVRQCLAEARAVLDRPAVPRGTVQQRAALRRANEVRLAHARLIDEVRTLATPSAGRNTASLRHQSAAVVIDALTSPADPIDSIRLHRLLPALRGWNEGKTIAALNAAGIRRSSMRIRDLTDRQRAALADYVAHWASTTTTTTSTA
ncbi:MAG: hypothetical protein QM679_10130 [Patulibacter sp.]